MLLVLLAAMFIFIPGCILKNENSNTYKVRLNEVTRSVFYAPQYVAMELGYFKDENLDITLTTSEGSDKTMAAVLSGQADIGLLGSSAVISVCDQGKENGPKIFAELTCRDGSFLVGRYPEFSWEKLKGKKIIAGRKGGMPEMTLEYVLKKHGIDILNDVDLINNIQFNLMSMAFSRGIGDYVALFEPIASLLPAEKENCYNLVPLALDCEKMVYTCYCANSKYLSENPEIIKKFTRAIYRAQKWVKNNSPKEIARVILPYFLDLSDDMAEKCVKNYISVDVWPDNPLVNESEFELSEEIMIQAGELKEKLDINKAVDNKISLEVINTMGD